jgi:hypothetical protein
VVTDGLTCRYFVTYTGVKLPLKLAREIGPLTISPPLDATTEQQPATTERALTTARVTSPSTRPDCAAVIPPRPDAVRASDTKHPVNATPRGHVR